MILKFVRQSGLRALSALGERFRSAKALRLPARWTISPVSATALLVVVTAVYAFGLGRARFKVTSDFLIRQPLPPGMLAPAVLGPLTGSPSMLRSLEDGRYLAFYLHSPEVMRRVFLRLLAERRYARRLPDLVAGLPADANRDQQLAFFRSQVQVWPQDLSGVIQLTTTGLDAQTALQLNQLLLQEARVFVNDMNQAISRDQLGFAQQEVQRSRQRLDQATAKLDAFKSRYGQLDPIQESAATSGLITALEASLVNLQVEEARLKRQFRDPQAPEVLVVTDQVQELQKQILKERDSVVSPGGKSLNNRATEATKLQNEVIFATENLKASMLAVENSRMESQRQLKFLVMLSDPQAPEVQDWNWRFQVFLGVVGGAIVIWGVASFLLGIRSRV